MLNPSILMNCLSSAGRLRKSAGLLPALAMMLFLCHGPAFGQKTHGVEAAVNVFGQFTGKTSGNGITDRPTRSMGGLVSVRQSFKPWLGYEVNWSYTRFSEDYSTFPFSVQNNVHEFTGAYLVQAPRMGIVQPFAAVGTGWLFFLPTTVGGQKQSLQTRVPLLYEVGLNLPLRNHFGARVEYRGFSYKTPDFKNPFFATGTRRQTGEPTVGLYVRF